MKRYGEWALVAGASEGLGAAFAAALAAEGYKLILLARRADALAAVAATLKVEVVTASVDLASDNLTDQLAPLLVGREVGVLVCNAAWAPLGPFADQTLADNLRAIDVNCRAPLTLVHLLAGPMLARGRGAVVLMSSLTAFQGSPYTATYGATKAFNLSLGEALWYEWGPRGVDVLACCAGATRTPNYLAAAAKGGAPGELDPAQVVDEALRHLGRGPTLVPGAFNRTASWVMRRLLARATTVRIMGSQTRRLQVGG